MKNYGKLTKKTVIDKNGRKRTVWVKNQNDTSELKQKNTSATFAEKEKWIREYLEKHNIKLGNTSKSKTDFGNSWYIPVEDYVVANSSIGIEIRISDHSKGIRNITSGKYIPISYNMTKEEVEAMLDKHLHVGEKKKKTVTEEFESPFTREELMHTHRFKNNLKISKIQDNIRVSKKGKPIHKYRMEYTKEEY